jgi:hypothetical protein
MCFCFLIIIISPAEILQFPPHNILTLLPDGNYTDGGSTPLYFAWLSEKLNFTYAELEMFFKTFKLFLS